MVGQAHVAEEDPETEAEQEARVGPAEQEPRAGPAVLGAWWRQQGEELG